MAIICKSFEDAVNLRMQYQLNQIFAKYGVGSADDYVHKQAYFLGFSTDFSPSVLEYFDGTPLKQEYLSGHESAEEMREIPLNMGTRAEFEALSPEEKNAQWDVFHEQCQQGTADDMYFYHVMSNIFMVGYVGH